MMAKILWAGLAVLGLAFPAAAQPADADLHAVTLRDAKGGQGTLADLVAGPTILHFWATWCAPCREELPELDAFAHELAVGERLGLISVDTAPYERIELLLADLDIGLESHQQIEGNVGSVFGILGYPSTVVVDETGAVLFFRQGALAWDDERVRAEMLDLLAP